MSDSEWEYNILQGNSILNINTTICETLLINTII